MDTRTILSQLRGEREHLAKAIAALESLESTGARRMQAWPSRSAAATNTSSKPGRRPMSAAARRRLSEMMKKRWAERKKAK